MKPWYTSKTIIGNLFAAVALFLMNEYGYDIGAYEPTVLILGNLGLRAMTTSGISM